MLQERCEERIGDEQGRKAGEAHGSDRSVQRALHRACDRYDRLLFLRIRQQAIVAGRMADTELQVKSAKHRKQCDRVERLKLI